MAGARVEHVLPGAGGVRAGGVPAGRRDPDEPAAGHPDVRVLLVLDHWRDEPRGGVAVRPRREPEVRLTDAGRADEVGVRVPAVGRGVLRAVDVLANEAVRVRRIHNYVESVTARRLD